METSENRGPQAGQVAIGFLVSSWITVTLRVYVRGMMIKVFGVDDYLALVSLALFTVYCVSVVVGVHYGTGRHLAEMILEPNGVRHFVLSMKAWWIAELAYVSCTTFLKLSIGFFLLRVCVKESHKMVIWVILSVVTVYSCYYFAFIIFQCLPISHFWNRFDVLHPSSKGKCVSNPIIAGSTYAHSALSAIADWTLGILPIFIVWDLKTVNTRTKVSVAIILALGALGSTATIVRIPFIRTLTLTHDFLFANVDVSIWSTIEPGIGITASAIATLRPLLVKFLSHSRPSRTSTTFPQGQIPQTPGSFKNGYFRSGSGNDNQPDSEELGLSEMHGGMPMGSNASTTIQGMHNARPSGDRYRVQRSKEKNDNKTNRLEDSPQGTTILDRKCIKQGTSATLDLDELSLWDDSSEEGTPVIMGLGIRKTTQVTTTTERRIDNQLKSETAWRSDKGIGLASTTNSEDG